MTSARMIKPILVTESMVTGSSIVEPDPAYPVWSAIPHVVGDTVSVTSGYHRRYRCAVDNTNDFPPDNSTNDASGNESWTDIGATNKFAPFDEIIGNQAVGSGTETYQLKTGVRFNSLPILNVDAASVQVVASTATGGPEYDYDKTVNTGGSRGGGWANFFRSGERRPIINTVFDNIPKFDDTVVDITFTGFSGVGLIVPGNEFIIGQTHAGVRPRIKSFSVKKFDANFGQPVLVPRLPAVRLSATVQIDTSRQDLVFETLKEFESTSAVWIFGSYSSATTYGWLDDYTPVLPSKPVISSAAQIKIKGFQ